MKTLFLLIAFATSLVANPLQDLDVLWQASVKEMQAPDPVLAVEGFKSWIERAGKLGIRSPEAHRNLGLALWRAKAPGASVYHILKSATLRLSPYQILSTTQLLSGMERELGIKEGVAGTFAFNLFLLCNRDWSVVFATLGFWLLAGLVVYQALKPHKLKETDFGIFAVVALCFFVGAGSFGYRRWGMRVGVLFHDESPVALYRNPEDKPEGKLVDLPSGTLVTLGKEENGFIQISQPVAGWIAAGSVNEVATDG